MSALVYAKFRNIQEECKLPAISGKLKVVASLSISNQKRNFSRISRVIFTSVIKWFYIDLNYFLNTIEVNINAF